MAEESGFQVEGDAPRYYESHVAMFMGPFVDALVAATIRQGDAVLDVACGTGFATRAAAAVAGRGARVAGVDLNPSMLAQARIVPDSSGANLGWWEASASDLPFKESQFDAVICQQGLQFFSDPVVAIREMRRVGRPGGRVGVTAWCEPQRSPLLHAEMAMLADLTGGEPAAYSATADQLKTWLTDGGLEDVLVEFVEVEIDLPPIAQYVPQHFKALPWASPFFETTDTERSAAMRQLDAVLDEYVTPDGIRVPFSSYQATAAI